jgi:hypothetical protein
MLANIFCQTYVRFNSFNKYLINVNSVPNIVLGSGDKALIRIPQLSGII